jgi:hypothetical protein
VILRAHQTKLLQNMKNPQEFYSFHKLALKPLLGDRIETTIDDLPKSFNLKEFSIFLCQQRLQCLWVEALGSIEMPRHFLSFKNDLSNACKLNIARELPQKRAMKDAHNLLTSAEIPYFFFKGTHLREVIYQQPWHRPAVDIDVFVNETNRDIVLNEFKQQAFIPSLTAETLSHELKISKHTTNIDLHWHLMRPTRYRPGLNEWLFAHREQFGDFWGLDHTASLLIMLTHPAITKYLISPTSMLIHQVDQFRLLQSNRIDWEVLLSALNEFGLRTAAWSSVYLLSKLADSTLNVEFGSSIQPGRIKSGYLRAWVNRGWVTRLFDARWLVAGGFNFALQDSLHDSVRAAIGTLSSRNPYTAKDQRS